MESQSQQQTVKQTFEGTEWKVEYRSDGSGRLLLDGETELGLTPPEARHLREELSEDDE